MKHLKTYKLFESFRENQIKEDIKDIFISEVDDESFDLIDATSQVPQGEFGFKVQKRTNKSSILLEVFEIKELKNFIERILDYSDLNPCEIKVYVPMTLGNKYIEKKDIYDNSPVIKDTHVVMIRVRAFK